MWAQRVSKFWVSEMMMKTAIEPCIGKANQLQRELGQLLLQ
jgi:hypothetical protein